MSETFPISSKDEFIIDAMRDFEVLRAETDQAVTLGDLLSDERILFLFNAGLSARETYERLEEMIRRVREPAAPSDGLRAEIERSLDYNPTWPRQHRKAIPFSEFLPEGTVANPPAILSPNASLAVEELQNAAAHLARGLVT